jgi:CCR4-NOT transcriptional regulation complex NOT5 subunit
MSAAEVAMNGTGYSRKKKSLGVLAENFIRQYQDVPSNRTTEIIVDDAAVQLGVERRRIYDVVNILEAIGLVSKKHKNTYAWLGMHPDHLSKIFGRLQATAIAAYPEDAGTFLFGTPRITEKQENDQGSQENKVDRIDPSSKSNEDQSVPPATPSSGSISMAQSDKGRENKSLAKLSQEFLQLFLVGHEVLSLPEASDKIQGTTSMEELIAMGTVNQSISSASSVKSTPAAAKPNEKNESTVFQPRTPSMVKEERERKAAAARGLKTKIRRLYDIANVFLSVGLLRKVEGGDSSRRPNFAWDYPWSAKQLYLMQQQQEKQLPTQPMPRGRMSCHTHSVAVPERQWGGEVTIAGVRHSVQNWQEGDKIAQ